MRHFLLYFFLSIVLMSHEAIAQETREFDLRHFVEALFNAQDEVLNYEELYERLLLLYENPLDLNQATAEMLLNIYLLSHHQVASLLEYIETHGKMVSLYELSYIPGFDANTIERLLPFVTVQPLNKGRDRPLLERIKNESNNYLILRYERTLEKSMGYNVQAGTTNPRYAGDPNKLYLRYRVARPGDFSIGITSEKDPGESFTWDPAARRYFSDFWSAHILLENNRKWKKILIGDYQLQFGQGLIFGAGFNVGKGAIAVNSLQRFDMGIRPYTSVLEGSFLRGAATSYQLTSHIRTTLFVSRLRQDANVKTGNQGPFDRYFSSFQLSGLHRTESEIHNKHQVSEVIYGFNLSYRPRELTQLGLTMAAQSFSTPFLKSNRPYNFLEFSGSKNYNLAMYGNTRWRQFNFFGEVAISKSGGLGAIGGLTATLSPGIDFALVLRRYEANFHAFHGTALAEGSRNINEFGTYWGLKYTLNKKIYFSAYYDSFRFPWLRFRIDRPSSGKDLLFRINYQPHGDLGLYFQYRKKIKDENEPDDNTLTMISTGFRNQYLLSLDFNTSESLSLNTRIQYSNFEIGDTRTHGLAVIQDLNYQWKNFLLSGRMALFDTEGAKNRQYTYERDVLYAFSIPAYTGRGIRNYMLLRLKVSRNISLWARIARTTYYDRNEIGTGLERIEGNKKTGIKLQVRYQIR